VTKLEPPLELSDDQANELRNRLIAQRAELEETISLSADGAKPVALDEPIGRISRVDAMQQQRMTKAHRDAARVRRQQTDTALARFETDTYGECLICGEPIGFARLSARPEAPLCVKCQGAREAGR
jgi:DnaK suppressor protein